jgi:hypothetical protein
MAELLPAPLDPDGLVWEHFGRQPIFRLSNGLREAMLQNTPTRPARPRGHGYGGLSTTDSADLMANSPSADRISVR